MPGHGQTGDPAYDRDDDQPGGRGRRPTELRHDQEPPLRQPSRNEAQFLGLPHEYYATLADRVGDVGVPIETLEELGIEAIAQDALGRPAGLAVGADGALHVSDDRAGFVYRIARN